MFTGIIEATAKVLRVTKNGLVVQRPKIFNDIKVGCSIAVSGTCLTVTEFSTTSMTFDVVETTLQKTKLGTLKKGDSVNLERAMRADGRFEGHIVLGHVEAVGKVVVAPSHTLSVELSQSLLPFIVPNGSITIDGVALTVAGFEKNIVTVALIPHTLEHTTLGDLKKGAPVNIETDILAKYLLNHVR